MKSRKRLADRERLSAHGLQRDYKKGRRDFRQVEVSGSDVLEIRGADLTGAMLRDVRWAGDLRGINLEGATIDSSAFFDCWLVGSNAARAKLTDVHFADAGLDHVVFDGATLEVVRMSAAEVAWASFNRTYLGGCDFRAVSFVEASIEDCRVDSCVFVDCDLGRLCDPKAVRVEGSCHFDVLSVLRSLRQSDKRRYDQGNQSELVSFLDRAGLGARLAAELVRHAEGAVGEDLRLYNSAFISYGGTDEGFARKLHRALTRAGIRAFYFPVSAEPGEALHQVMRRGINSHDRVVLICSRASLNRPGVLNEINETLAREAREGGQSRLVPIAIDDYVFQHWQPSDDDLRNAIRGRVIADFVGADRSRLKFQKGMKVLLQSLRPVVRSS